MPREAEPPPGRWPDLSGVPTKIPELEGIFESMRPKRPPGTPKNGKDVWEKLKHGLESPLSLYYTVLGNPDLLFSEATQAFDARLTAAASLLCRATLEAACYLFLTTKPATTRKGIKEKFPLTLDGQVRKVQFAHKKGITEDQRFREEMKVRRILRFWIDGDEVLEDLIDTASILQTLAKHISLPIIPRSSRESS